MKRAPARIRLRPGAERPMVDWGRAESNRLRRAVPRCPSCVRARLPHEGRARQRRGADHERTDTDRARSGLRPRPHALPARDALALTRRLRAGVVHGPGRAMRVPLDAGRGVRAGLREGRSRARLHGRCWTDAALRGATGGGPGRRDSRGRSVRRGARHRVSPRRPRALRTPIAIACNLHTRLRGGGAASGRRRPCGDRRGVQEVAGVDFDFDARAPSLRSGSRCC